MRLDIGYELDRDEIDEIVIEELKDYIKLKLEFLSDPEHYEEEERQETIEDVANLKAVVAMYMDSSDYKEFLEELTIYE